MDYTEELIISESYQEVEIIGKYPGFNEMITAAKVIGRTHTGKNKYSAYNTIKKQWETKIINLISERKFYSVDKIFLDLIWIEQNRRRDPDNIAAFVKVLLDALQKAEVIKSDNLGVVLGWRNRFRVGVERKLIARVYEANER